MERMEQPALEVQVLDHHLLKLPPGYTPTGPLQLNGQHGRPRFTKQGQLLL